MTAESRLIWSLAWRFVRGRRTRLLAGTTWAALLATALGVAAMVMAMAVMTGYRHDLQATTGFSERNRANDYALK